jgi:hypothetical protein
MGAFPALCAGNRAVRFNLLAQPKGFPLLSLALLYLDNYGFLGTEL